MSDAMSVIALLRHSKIADGLLLSEKSGRAADISAMTEIDANRQSDHPPSGQDLNTSGACPIAGVFWRLELEQFRIRILLD
jgi:hypothetical protein